MGEGEASVAQAIETVRPDPIPWLPRQPNLTSVVSAPFLLAGFFSPNDYPSVPLQHPGTRVPVSQYERWSRDCLFQVAQPALKTRDINRAARMADDLAICGKPGSVRWPDPLCPASAVSLQSPSGGGWGPATRRRRRRAPERAAAPVVSEAPPQTTHF